VVLNYSSISKKSYIILLISGAYLSTKFTNI